MQKDHALGLRREMRASLRWRGREQIDPEQRSERRDANAPGGESDNRPSRRPYPIPTSCGLVRLSSSSLFMAHGSINHCLVIVSSRLRIALMTIVHAA